MGLVQNDKRVLIKKVINFLYGKFKKLTLDLYGTYKGGTDEGGTRGEERPYTECENEQGERHKPDVNQSQKPPFYVW